MNRYQIYLDPATVSTGDQISRSLSISRSQIFRDVLDRTMREFAKAFARPITKLGSKSDPLMKMSGIGKSNTPNISRDVDSIYLRD